MKTLTCCLAFILFFASCGPGDRICKTNGLARECSAEEEKMIDGINAIIKTVYHFDRLSSPRAFKAWAATNFANTRKVIFFGEDHTQIIGQMETLGAINILASNGGTILLEGLVDSKDGMPCDFRLVYQIYLNWQWEKLGQEYDPQEKSTWERSHGLF